MPAPGPPLRPPTPRGGAAAQERGADAPTPGVDGPNLEHWSARVALWLIVVASLAWLVLEIPGLWAIAAVLLAAPAVVIMLGLTAREGITVILGIASLVSILNYISWRGTVVHWAAWWVAVPLLAAESLGALHMLGIQHTAWPRRDSPLCRDLDAAALPVFIFVPTVNEGIDVLRPTLEAAVTARETYLATHPAASVTIVVCNDGRVAEYERWRDVDALAAELGIRCVTRERGGGAKAGNIEHARQVVGAASDSLLVVFDADQVAHPDFLLRTTPQMSDASVGWVQTAQSYSNLDNRVAKWAHDQQALFYEMLCPGKSTINSAFICGTNVVIRAQALDEIGGFPQDSVTEDFAASIRLHHRWRGVYVDGVLATGLGPMDLRAYFAQQGRWARGTLGILRTDAWRIVSPRRGGLSLSQRIQYGIAATHYLCGLRDLIFLLAPLAFIFTGIPAVKGATLAEFLMHFVPMLVISQASFWWLVARHTGLRGILMGFASFPVLVGALLSVIAGAGRRFTVTSKSRATQIRWSHLTPHAATFALSAAGVAVALASGRTGPAFVITLVWVLYSMVGLGAVLWLGWADNIDHLAAAPRARPHRASASEQPTPARSERFPVTVVAAGAALVLGIVMGGLAGRAILVSDRSVPAAASGSTLVVGLALPHGAGPEDAEGIDYASLGIVGRTQVIGDAFDSAWAEGLRSQGALPWITLLFEPDDDEELTVDAELAAGLAAIGNGAHDDALEEWADAIAEFGAPVYLTVLPHVDRDWSLTTAVARGGAPADVPRAWQRIHDVLRGNGADNALMVWSPADPAADHDYSPPAEQVDAVLLSLIRYPGDPWPSAADALSAVAAQHPDAPLLLELGANGSGSQRASWLREAADVARSHPLVEALVYHDSAPDSEANAVTSARLAWRLAADGDSLQAFGEVIESNRVGDPDSTAPPEDSAPEPPEESTTEPGQGSAHARSPRGVLPTPTRAPAEAGPDEGTP